MERKIVKHLATLSVLFFFLILALGTAEDDTPWQERDERIGAYIMTQDWVKERLVSPGSAEFPGATKKRDHTTHLGGQKYRIESYVDSQNRMGASLRTHFTAVVEQVEKDKWTLHSLELHE